MKRRAIRFGKTYVVSLPLAWTRRYGVASKRELDVVETASGALVVSPISAATKMKVGISAGNSDSHSIFWKVLNAYVKGYKEIAITGLRDTEQWGIIGLVQKRLVGIEVSDQSSDSVTFSDLLKPEDADLDKTVGQMFSMLSAMAANIVESIRIGKEPGEKIMEMDTVVDRLHHLAVRCCNVALQDSVYLEAIGKRPSEVLIASRVLKSLEFIGNLLVGMSYLVNRKLTPGMRRYRFAVFPRNPALYRALADHLEGWSRYFLGIRSAVMKKNFEKSSLLYKRRFEEKIDVSKYEIKEDRHLVMLLNFAEQLNRTSSSIVRDALLL